MIITVTMNPALDKTAHLDRLRIGALNRLGAVQVDAGGKGVNVSRVVRALGGESLCCGFAAGGAGDVLLAGIAAMGIAHDFVRVAGETRTNLKVLDAAGALTELNEPGPGVTAAEVDALLDRLLARVAGAVAARQGETGGATPGKAEHGPVAAKPIVVLSGSLPKGAPEDTYLHFARTLGAAGAAVFVDADGPAFRRALEAPPAVVKPNRHELLEYFGAPADTSLAGCAALCSRLLAGGVGLVALSMGADGALFVTKERTVHAPGLAVEARSPVGAGDSMVAALALAAQRGLGFEAAAAFAMAVSAAAVTTEGTTPPDAAMVEALLPRVVLTPPV